MGLIGNAQPEGETLKIMRERMYPGARWAAYQNHDLGSRDIGHLQFLLVGSDSTFKEAPQRLPDTPTKINWRYWHVGFVDMTTGKIEG